MNIKRKILEWVNEELAKDYEHELKMMKNHQEHVEASYQAVIEGYRAQCDAMDQWGDGLFAEKKNLEIEIERLHQVVKSLKGLGAGFGAKTEGKKLKI